MRPAKLNIRVIISVILLLFICTTRIVSQGTDISKSRKNHLFLGVSISPSQTKIVNNGTETISGLSISQKNSFGISVDAGYFFSKFFGLSTGLGYSSYLTHLSLDTYVNSFDTTDSENETYERRISGDNIKEIQKISFLNIPLLVNVQLPLGKSFGFHLQSGLSLSIPLNKTYSCKGTFTYSGYYPAYNVLITDIPYEGFQSNVENDVNDVLKIKTLCPELISSAGFHFYIKEVTQFSFSVFYNQFLTDISGYSPAPAFRLSTQKNQIRSMMEGSDKVSASSMGIMVSFRYYLF